MPRLRKRLRRWRRGVRRWLRSQLSAWRARLREPDLFDAALGRPTRHSSGDETPAWWMVELEADWPIHSVRIHPSRDRAPAKPSTPDLSLSPDGDQWVVVPSGEREAADPLVVRLPARHGGRFVKLELPVTGQLSFSRIEVMVECRHAAMLRVAQRNDFVFVYLTSLRMRRSVKPYFLRNVPAGFDGTIGALHLNALQGRFGNNVQQIGTAVCLARHLGLDRLYLGKLPLLDIESPVAFDSLTVMPDSELERDRPQAVLCGTFYYKEVFGPAFGALDYRQIAAAARAVARPIFERQAARSAFIPAATDLAIHLRAGDIFAHKNPHPDYVQPPLAFYQMCVGFAQSELGIKRLVLVYQDEGNPCVGALKAWLDQTGLPYVVQSGTLPDDLAVLLAAQHCIFGRGTFGHAIAILSRNMRTVFHSWLAPDFAKLSEVCGVRTIGVDDAAKAYMPVGSWRNAPEQLRMMLDYPLENLRLQPGLLPDRRDVTEKPLVVAAEAVR